YIFLFARAHVHNQKIHSAVLSYRIRLQSHLRNKKLDQRTESRHVQN
ncbi:hypothetical protein CP8484711_1323B, partial [Chlamydia psittaci 84-8471/1]